MSVANGLLGRRVALLALFVVPAATALLILLVAGRGSEGGQRVVAVEPGMSHVHGLGTNPGDNATYVATHSGVFRVAGATVRVANRYQDTMGFTVVGADHFLGSGHPDLADESLQTHLGLIESTDAARTWQEISLGGEADLHALDSGPGGIFAFDALSGRLMSSPDGAEWDVIAEGAVADVAADPERSGSVMVTTPDGELVAYDGRGGGVMLPQAPPLALIDWPRSELLVGVAPDGQWYRSDDRGMSWQEVGTPLGAPQAADASGEAWLLATEEAVLRSADEGRTWEELVRFAS